MAPYFIQRSWWKYKVKYFKINKTEKNKLNKFSTSDLGKDLDGLDLWEEISNDLLSKRMDILHNIDDIYGSASLSIGDWKVMKGTNYEGVWDSWYGPDGLRNVSSYDVNAIFKSSAGKAISSLNLMPSEEIIRSLREEAAVDCRKNIEADLIQYTCEPLVRPCLFNVKEDPCEQFNLAEM